MERSQKALIIDNIDEELESLLFDLQEVLSKRKVDFQPFTPGSQKIFKQKPYEMKAGVLHGTQAYLEILKTFINISETSEDFETVDEDIQLLEIALNRFNLKPPRDERFGFLKQGWVVEIYNREMIQIYRNFEFFRQCSYDLYSVLVNEWHVLYERNSQITNAIFKRVGYVLEQGKETIPFNIPDHTLKERYLDHNKIFFSSTKYLTPLFDKKTGKRAGFMNCIESYPIAKMSNVKHL